MKNKIRSLNRNKNRVFNTNCKCTIKSLMTMLRFSEKRLLVDVKAKYLLLEIRLLDVKTKLGSLADVA